MDQATTSNSTAMASEEKQVDPGESVSEIAQTLCKLSILQSDVDFEKHIEILVQHCLEKSIQLSEIFQQFDCEPLTQLPRGLVKFDRIILFSTALCSRSKCSVNPILGKTFFSKVWNNNHVFQLEFIKFCLDHDLVSTILQASQNELDQDDNYIIEVPSQLSKQESNKEIRTTWKYQRLFSILLQLSTFPSSSAKVQEIFAIPIDKCPDLAMLGLMQCYQINTDLKNQMVVKSIVKLLSPGNSNYNQLIHKLWFPDFEHTPNSSFTGFQQILREAIIEFYESSTSHEEQQTRLVRILELSHELKALNFLLSHSAYYFVIDLACLAARREFIKLDKWINDKITTIGQSFVNACMHYMDKKFVIFQTDNRQIDKMVESITIIYSCLSSYFEMNSASSERLELFKLYNNLLNINPNLAQILRDTAELSRSILSVSPDTTTPDIITLEGESRPQFPADIVDEADTYIRNCFISNPNMKVCCNQLLVWKNSIHKRENDLFNCIITNLLKELSFVADHDPPELEFLAKLTGELMNMNLVSEEIITHLLNSTLTNLKYPKNKNNLSFAVSMMEVFKTKLPNYPSFCMQLRDLPIYIQFPNSLTVYIEKGRSIAFETVLKPKISYEEKLNFAFNNLAPNNLQKTAKQFVEHCQDLEFRDQLSQYFTIRATKEANHHNLFLTLLDALETCNLYSNIVSRTYSEIQKLLKLITVDTHRQKLYSAGQWLGLITLKRNKPILTLQVNLHSLIIEAHFKGLLQLVIPFIVKILLSCTHSQVFKPPNPWTMSLIFFLGEVHSKLNSSLKTRLEIENLCKTLELDIKNYVGSEITSKVESHVRIGEEQLPPMSSETMNTGSQGDMPTTEDDLSITGTTLSVAAEANLARFVESLQLHSRVPLLQEYPTLIKSIKISFAKAINHSINFFAKNFYFGIMMGPELLIKKDFALDPTCEKMLQAANNMTFLLLGSFIQAQCREMLANNINQLLIADFSKEFNSIARENIQAMISTIITNNIDLCINFIAEHFIDAGLADIENRLKFEVEARQKADGQYYDPKVNTLQMTRMPDSIRIIPQITPASKLGVYEEFATLSEKLRVQLNSTVSPLPITNGPTDPPESVNFSSLIRNGNISTVFELVIKSFEDLRVKFTALTKPVPQAFGPIVKHLMQMRKNPIDQQAVSNLIKIIVLGLRELRSFSSDSVLYFKLLTDTRDCYLLLTKVISTKGAYKFPISRMITKVITDYWFGIPEFKFPDEIFEGFRQTSQITFEVIDDEFARFLENPSMAIMKIVLNFFKCYLDDELKSKFSQTIDSLRKLIGRIPHNSPVYTELKKLFEKFNLAPITVTSMLEPPVDRNAQILTYFRCWYHNYSSTTTTEFNLLFLNSLEEQGLLQIDVLGVVFELCFGVCYLNCKQLLNYSNPTNIVEVHRKCSLYLDAFSYLVIAIIKLQEDLNCKCRILNLCLRTLLNHAHVEQQKVMRSLANSAEGSTDFAPLGHYRVMVVLFLELCYNHSIYHFDDISAFRIFFDQSLRQILLKTFCKCLLLMSPLYIPSFIFAWLEFISHRGFLGMCLNFIDKPEIELQKAYCLLLSDLLRFQRPFIQSMQATDSFTYLQRGTVKLFLLLLHDFPDFLCEYAYLLCDMLPYSALQLRNIMQSAHPSSATMIPPEKASFADARRLSLLNVYRGSVNNGALEKMAYRSDFDAFYQSHFSASLVRTLQTYFESSNTNVQHQIEYISVIMYYLSQKVVSSGSTGEITDKANHPSVGILKGLLSIFDTERRYYLLNGIVNHLRYPNPETFHFIVVLLFLFQNSNVSIKEQIVRALLERIMVPGPSPWGIIFTMNELVRNPSYNLTSFEFWANVETKFQKEGILLP